MKQRETATMQLISDRLQAKGGPDLYNFILAMRDPTRQGGPMGWNDLTFEIYRLTTVRVVRESLRMWARDRYGIPEPEHDYGVPAAETAPSP